MKLKTWFINSGQDRHVVYIHREAIKARLNQATSDETEHVPNDKIPSLVGCTVLEVKRVYESLYLVAGFDDRITVMKYNTELKEFCIRKVSDGIHFCIWAIWLLVLVLFCTGNVRAHMLKIYIPVIFLYTCSVIIQLHYSEFWKCFSKMLIYINMSFYFDIMHVIIYMFIFFDLHESIDYYLSLSHM